MPWTSETFNLCVSLAYGLSYFALLAAVLYYTIKGVHIDLVESFILLGWFAFLHGIADTSIVFTIPPLKGLVPLGLAVVFRVALEYASYVALMKFCIKIFIREDMSRDFIDKYLRLVNVGTLAFIVTALAAGLAEEMVRFVAVIVGFPVFLLSGGAFFLLARQPKSVRVKRLYLAFNGIAACFALLALLKIVRISTGTDVVVETIRIIRLVTILFLAYFTSLGLSRLKAKKKN